MIDVEGLKAFVTIAELGSFTGAANRLNISQSIISKRLKRLEHQLSIKLIDRSTKSRISLTRTGKMFLSEAIQTVSALEAVERSGRNLARGREGPLRVGFIFSAAMSGTLTRLLGDLHTSLPEIGLQPQLMETPQQLKALAAGLLDVALVRPRPSYPEQCHAITIHSEPLGICLSADHVLAGQTSIFPSVLASEKFILPQFDEQVGLIESIRRLARAGRFAMPELIKTADYVSAACLASANNGVVLAPASLANLRIEGTCFRSLASNAEDLDTVLVYRRDAPTEALAHMLRCSIV